MVPAQPVGRLDIVIVNYETPGLLDKCLLSIDADGVREVIVVDNSIMPEPAALVVRNHAAVRLVRSTTNEGYGSGANRGIAACTGEYVLLLNADAQLHAGATQALVEELDLHSDAGVVGPRLIDGHDRIQLSCARFPTAGRLLFQETGLWKLVPSSRLRVRAQPFFDLEEPGDVPWVLGAALAIRRRAFEAVGGFDTKYFMYYEEVDLCRRLAARGTPTRFTPAATIGHVGGASTDLNPAPMQREMFRSLARYTRCHGRDPGLVRLRMVVVAIACARLIQAGLINSTRHRRARARQSAAPWRAIVGDALGGWR